MPTVRLKYGPCLAMEQVREAYNPRHTKFWVARIDENKAIVSFVDMGKHSACYPLAIDLELPYGSYVLGTGWGRYRLRKYFDVDMFGIRFKQ